MGTILPLEMLVCCSEQQAALRGGLTPNQVVGLTYDAAGNVTVDNATPANTWSYDAEGRQLTVAGYTYTYDGDGHRVEKSGANSHLYWYGADGSVLTDTDLIGSTPNRNIYFKGQLALRILNGASTHYFLRDHLGSLRVTVNPVGGIQDNLDYYPWGNISQGSVTSGSLTTFTGDEGDTESSSFHTDFRQLSSSLGRWLRPDPYSGSYDYKNPQSLNRYAYVLNNPLAYVDPDGTSDDGYGFWGGWSSHGGSGPLGGYFQASLAEALAGTGSDHGDPSAPNPFDPGDHDLSGWENFSPLPDGSDSSNNGTQVSQGCQDTLLNLINSEHGTNFTATNVTATYNNGTAANLIIDASGLTPAQFNSFEPGRYTTYSGQWLLGFGLAGHIANEPGVNPGAVFSNQNVGGNLSVHFAFHDDHGYANNPLGALIHLAEDVVGHNSRGPC